MKKEYIIKNKDGKYKIPRFIRFMIYLNFNFKFEYNNKLYNHKIDVDDKEVKQISMLVECLNIKKRKPRLRMVYDMACELLDSDFYGKNICEFRDNKCIHDRLHATSCDGCCRSNDGSRRCKYIANHRCTTKCLACKFHICYCIRNKGYKYKVNDIYVLKYLYNWKQKLIIYTDFFMTEDEVLKDVYRNSIIFWSLFTKTKKFIHEKK